MRYRIRLRRLHRALTKTRPAFPEHLLERLTKPEDLFGPVRMERLRQAAENRDNPFLRGHW